MKAPGFRRVRMGRSELAHKSPDDRQQESEYLQGISRLELLVGLGS